MSLQITTVTTIRDFLVDEANTLEVSVELEEFWVPFTIKAGCTEHTLSTVDVRTLVKVLNRALLIYKRANAEES